MASPFRVFRKYLKPLMVVFGVMIMFVFVILDPLSSYLGGGRRGYPTGSDRSLSSVAVRWDGGHLTNLELDRLVQRRRIVNAFVRGVAMAGAESAVAAGMDPRDLTYPVQPIIGAETLAQGVEGDVVRMKLFADAAREAGMRVSDEAIVSYLDELGRKNVSREQMREMLKRLPGDVRVPIQFVIDALRDEMLARNYVASYAYAFDTVTPDERYSDWLNVNDRIVLEAAPIAVESFLIDVPEPSDTELAQFFDDHKNREPQPDLIGQTEYPSPTPGFRIPRKIDVQYIEAEYEPFVTKVENEITDEEIAKYYQENKELFVRADTGLSDAENEQTDAAEPAATQPPSQPANGNDSHENAESPGAANDEATPAAADAPVSEETHTPEPPAGGQAAPTNGEKSSRDDARRNSRVRLAAFLQVPESQDAAATDDAADALTSASQSPPATETPATDTPATETPTAEGGQPPESAADATTDSAPGNEPPATVSPPQPKQYQSIEEVRDLIRRELAGRKVHEQLNTLMNELQTQLNGEFTRYFSEKLNAAGKEPPPPPPELVNLAPLAKQHGLNHGTTGPMSVLELRNTPVGASGDLERQSELFRILFGSHDVEMYEPVSTQDIDGNRYLAMKVGDTPGRVPQLAEVRNDVVQAWKRSQAAEVALKHAQELAKKAQDAQSPLPSFFAGQSIEVVRTDPFARYTGGEIGVVNGEFQQQPFRLSEPDGIVAAGPEFMDKVFELKKGEVGAALNHDNSIAYVVRVAEHQLPEDELRTTYLSEAHNWPGVNIMARSHAQTAARLLVSDILASKALKWERTPDDLRQHEEEVE